MSGSATSTYSSPFVVFFQPWSTTKCPPPPVQPILAPSGFLEAIRPVKSAKLTTPLRTSNKLEVAFRALSRYQGTSQAETRSVCATIFSTRQREYTVGQNALGPPAHTFVEVRNACCSRCPAPVVLELRLHGERDCIHSWCYWRGSPAGAAAAPKCKPSRGQRGFPGDH